MNAGRASHGSGHPAENNPQPPTPFVVPADAGRRTPDVVCRLSKSSGFGCGRRRCVVIQGRVDATLKQEASSNDAPAPAAGLRLALNLTLPFLTHRQGSRGEASRYWYVPWWGSSLLLQDLEDQNLRQKKATSERRTTSILFFMWEWSEPCQLCPLWPDGRLCSGSVEGAKRTGPAVLLACDRLS